MKKNIIIMTIFAVSVLAATGVFAGIVPVNNAGTTAADFLKIGQGARPSSMGEAFISIADDVNASYWNPAGLTNLSVWQVSGMRNQWFANITSNFIAAGFPTTDGVFGVHIVQLDAGGDPATTLSETGIGGYEPVETGNKTIAQDMALAVSYARVPAPVSVPMLSVGANFKVISRTLGDTAESYNASAIALDLGLLYTLEKLPVPVRTALVVQNVGLTPIKFISETEQLPMTIKLGLSSPVFETIEHKVTPAVDICFPNDNATKINMGIEYGYNGMLFLRAGYRGMGSIDNTALGGMTGITAGVGFRYWNCQMDVAYAPYGILGDTIRVSLTYNFGFLPF